MARGEIARLRAVLKRPKKSARAQSHARSRTPAGRLQQLRSSAKRRGYTCTITLGQMELLLARPCTYCGGHLQETGGGLDRIDNTRGYETDNVAACCKICNMAKGTQTAAEFELWIRTVHKRLRACSILALVDDLGGAGPKEAV